MKRINSTIIMMMACCLVCAGNALAESGEHDIATLSKIVFDSTKPSLIPGAVHALSEIGTMEAADIVAKALDEHVISGEMYPATTLVLRVRFTAIREDSELFNALSHIMRGAEHDPLRHVDKSDADFHWRDRLAAAGMLGYAGYDTVDFLVAAYHNPGALLNEHLVRDFVLAMLSQSHTERAAEEVSEIIADRWLVDVVSHIGAMHSSGNPYSITVVRRVTSDDLWRRVKDKEVLDFVLAATLVRVVEAYGTLEDLDQLERQLDIASWSDEDGIHAYIASVRRMLEQ